jgi:hypothetical protein
LLVVEVRGDLLHLYGRTSGLASLLTGGALLAILREGRAIERIAHSQVAWLLGERNVMLGAIAHDIKTYVQRLKLRLDVLDDPTQVQKAMLDLDVIDKLVEDSLLVAVHANAWKTREAVELLTLVADEVEAARI